MLSAVLLTVITFLSVTGNEAFVVGRSTHTIPTLDEHRLAQKFQLEQDGRPWLRMLDLNDSRYGIFGMGQQFVHISYSSMNGTSTQFATTAPRADQCSTLGSQLGATADVCRTNYVRALSAQDDGWRRVFGSGRGLGACQLYAYDEENGAWTAGGPCDAAAYASFFAPVLPWINFTYLRAGDGALYTGGFFYRFVTGFNPSVFKFDPGSGEAMSSTEAATGIYSLRVLNSRDEPSDSRIYPDFVRSYETAAHIYWIFSESAMETEPFVHRKVTRVGRVCKNDKSHEMYSSRQYRSGAQVFTTFWKATLDCSVSGLHLHTRENTYATGGYNAFSFDNVGGASVLHLASVRGHWGNTDLKEIMYAVFNTDRNSIIGSALCAFEKSSIEDAFDGPFYTLEPLQDLGLNSINSQWTWKRYDYSERKYTGKAHPAQCSENTWDRPLDNLYMDQSLLARKIRPITGGPLLIQTSHWYFMTALAVDWQVRALDGKYYDVIFIGTDEGLILKVVNVASENLIDFQVIEKRKISKEGHARVAEMELVNQSLLAETSQLKKMLLISTFDAVYNMAAENCGAYKTCQKCVRSRDPYCAWKVAAGICVEILYGFNQSDYVQNISSGADDRCAQAASDRDGSLLVFGASTISPATIGLTVGMIAAVSLIAFGAGWAIGYAANAAADDTATTQSSGIKLPSSGT